MFFEQSPPKPQKRRKNAFLIIIEAIFIAADHNPWILEKLINFHKFLLFFEELPMSSHCNALFGDFGIFRKPADSAPKPPVLPEKAG